MKRETPQEELLRDLFAEVLPNSGQNETTKQAVLSEYRRTHRRKSDARFLAVAAVIMAGTATFWSFRLEQETIVQPSVTAAGPAVISDAELLAAFPPNSCFIAELDGKKTLVFNDPEMARRFVDH